MWISKRGFHFGFIPSIILNIIGKDKSSTLGILTEKVRWISTYNKYHDYSLFLFKIKESSCDTDGYRQEARHRCQFLWSNVVSYLLKTESTANSRISLAFFLGKMDICYLELFNNEHDHSQVSSGRYRFSYCTNYF